MNHLVLGATGSLGRSIVKILNQSNEDVRAFVRNREKAKKYLEDVNDIEIIIGNAENETDIVNAAKGADILYYGIHIPYQRWEKEARKLLNASINAAIKTKTKLVFPGNVYVYKGVWR